MRKMLMVTSIILMVALLAVNSAVWADEIPQEKYDQAIELLHGLGIIAEDEEGFRPEDLCTRAELAKLLTHILGLGDDVQNFESESQYKDVPKDYWALGYINVITAMGITKGTPEELFEPDASVTYEQTIAMLVRALGYEEMAMAKGAYPTGYLLEAIDLGIVKDFKWSNMGSNILRKDIALLISRCVDISIAEEK